MPIVRLISEGAFKPEEMHVVREAYEIVTARLDLQTARSREQAAKTVVRLARNRGHLRAEELAEAAIIALKNT